MDEGRAVLEAALQAQSEGRAAALATVVAAEGSVPRRAGSKMLVWADGRIVGTVGGGAVEAQVIDEAQAALQDGQTRLLTYKLNAPSAEEGLGVCGGTMHIFVEPLLPPPTLIVIGVGHVGRAVAELAKWLGLRVVVADDRPNTATAEHIPGADAYIEAPAEELAAALELTPRTYVVAVTRGLAVDRHILPPLLASEAPYIGVIGSRRRWALTAKKLREDGVSEAALARVHTPIGLDIGAETPKEIAVSILAEVIRTMRREKGDAARPEPTLALRGKGADEEG